jgi:hypothetical protein
MMRRRHFRLIVALWCAVVASPVSVTSLKGSLEAK